MGKNYSKLEKFKTKKDPEEDVTFESLGIPSWVKRFEFEDFKLIRILGRGDGKTFLAEKIRKEGEEEKETDEDVKKKYILKNYRYPRGVKAILPNRDSYRIIHPSLNNLIGVIVRAPRFGVVFEYIEGVDLDDFIQSFNEEEVSMEDRIDLVFQLACAMKLLENKAPEILEQYEFKTTRCFIEKRKILQSSTTTTELNNEDKKEYFLKLRHLLPYVDYSAISHYYTGRVGSSWSEGIFATPELVLEGKLSSKSTVFQFSILSYMLLFGKFPYDNRDYYGLAMKVSENLRPKNVLEGEEKKKYGWIFKLLQKCWRREPSERPIFTEVVSEFSKRGYFEKSLIVEKDERERISYLVDRHQHEFRDNLLRIDLQAKQKDNRHIIMILKRFV